MTNFEKYTKNAFMLSMLIEQIVDDALEAEGCSAKLKMPDAETCMTWEQWLKKEAE